MVVLSAFYSEHQNPQDLRLLGLFPQEHRGSAIENRTWVVYCKILKHLKVGTQVSTLTLVCSIQNKALKSRKEAPKVSQVSCVHLFFDPMDCSPLCSSVHGILQARILEWVAVPSSRGSSQPRDQTEVSCIAGGFLTIWATREDHLFFSSNPRNSEWEYPQTEQCWGLGGSFRDSRVSLGTSLRVPLQFWPGAH